MKRCFLAVVPLIALIGISLSGCAASPSATGSHPTAVPVNAQLIAEGVPPLSVVVSRPGVVYLFDKSTQSMPHSADLSGMTGVTGVVLSFDLEHKAFTARVPPQKYEDGTVLLSPVDVTHRYQIWFVANHGETETLGKMDEKKADKDEKKAEK